jgi:hypothetical protein
VATGRDGQALITSAGQGRIEIRRDSLVSLGPDEIELRSGVAGSERTAIRLGGYRIEPTGKTAAGHWFVVARRGAKTFLAAYRGNLLVRSDRSAATLVIPEGYYAAPSEAAEDDGRDASKDQPKSGQLPGWTIGSLSRKANIALAASLGALAAAGTLLAIELLETPVSPAR